MKEIRLYVFTDAPVRGADRRKMSWLMQYVRDGEVTGSREDHALIDGNQKRLTLEGIIDAVGRIKDGNDTPLVIVCHCPGVITAVNQSQLAKWSMNGWKNSKGGEVECAEEWQRVMRLFSDKAEEVTARPPSPSEDRIMQELGAESFEARLNIA